MPPAAILDIDGTLVDTNYQHALAWYMAFRQHDVRLPVWRIHRHIGMGGDQLVAALAGEEVDRELGDDIRAAEKALYLASIQTVEPLGRAPAHRGPQGPGTPRRAGELGRVLVAILELVVGEKLAP